MENAVNDLLDAVRPERELTDVECNVVTEIAQSGHAKMSEGEEIGAAVIRNLLLNADEVPGGQIGRITIDGGKIAGKLDLTGLHLDFTLRLRWMELEELCLTDTRILTLELIGGSAKEIVGDRLDVAH